MQTRVSGLQPGTEYDVALVATNQYGSSNGSSFGAFRTPQNIRLKLRRLKPASLVFGSDSLRVIVTVTGRFSRFIPVDLQVAAAPYLANEVLPSRTGTTKIAACALTDEEGACPWLQQNFKVRVKDGNARTRSAIVYVYPNITPDVQRENDGGSPWLDAMLQAEVHQLHGRYHSPPVFFYEGPSRRGPFSLVKVSRFRLYSTTLSGTYLIATARINHPDGGDTIACYRRRVVPDMGDPSVFAACGQPTLP